MARATNPEQRAQGVVSQRLFHIPDGCSRPADKLMVRPCCRTTSTRWRAPRCRGASARALCWRPPHSWPPPAAAASRRCSMSNPQRAAAAVAGPRPPRSWLPRRNGDQAPQSSVSGLQWGAAASVGWQLGSSPGASATDSSMKKLRFKSAVRCPSFYFVTAYAVPCVSWHRVEYAIP